MIHIGLDVGAVSVKLAAVGAIADAPIAERIAESTFFFPSLPVTDGRRNLPLLFSTYRRVQGNPLRAASELLRDLYELVPEDSIAAIRFTGSGGKRIAAIFDAEFENEFRALVRGIRSLYPQVRTVIEIGGDTSKYLRLSESCSSNDLGILDYQSSSECAAGTGSFIDQQALRLLYDVEDVGAASCRAVCAARVAGRCSVFAKTDMIHAQQKGYAADQILRGLCDAVARNFKSSIVKGRRLVPPVAFVGGVALNAGVRRALQEAFGLRDSEFVVPDAPCWMPALGAGMAALDAKGKAKRLAFPEFRDTTGDAERIPTTDALSLDNVCLLRNQMPAVRPGLPSGGVDAYLGIDVGSVSTNLVVLDKHCNLLKEIYVPTAGRPIEVVSAGLREIEQELGSGIRIRGVGTTGSGRELIGELTGADSVSDEITAHKTGATHVCRKMNMPLVDTIFEIGGQDSKFIRLRNGVVVDFCMNEACAAGTGSFLEEQAEKLGVAIKGEFARLALSSQHPIRLGERCTVFMGRDVSSLLLKGAAVPDLCAGLAYSVALNYLNRVVRGRRLGDVIYFQGGTAYNDAIAAAFSIILKRPIIVPPHNGVIGAIGMALIARDRMLDSGQASKFRGFDLARVKWTSRDFVCRACSNYCDMKEFVIEGEKTYWGDQCSDKFRKRSRTEREPVVDDLISLRDRLLEASSKPSQQDRKAIGIPRAMFFYDRFPFWCAYLQALGYNVVVSPPTDAGIAAKGEELAIAQPCFPVQLAHGHVQALLKSDVHHILLPNAVDAETPFMKAESKFCPWNQTLPFVVRAVQDLERDLEGRLLCPTVHFRQGPQHVSAELRTLALSLGHSKRESDLAVTQAYQAQRSFVRDLQQAGQSAVRALEAKQEPGIILLGRPYNIYDRAACCDIPRKLRTLYGVNIVPLDFLPLDTGDVSEINDNMYWHSGRLILAAARFARSHPFLHLIYISNFKCGPDSYLKSFIEEASGKPSLILQFDGHSNDAGYITRCEAFLDSTGFLRCHSSRTAA
ncbi:MAG TPA: acyl-CoA dehydratase activase [Verrucomicrobiae bacterium]|nr:acyl-CoA dehydratase activase [Verrucomicrobiae bacterium]